MLFSINFNTSLLDLLIRYHLIGCERRTVEDQGMVRSYSEFRGYLTEELLD